MRALMPLLSSAAILAACANTVTPRYDLRFGDAVRDARQRMVLNARPATPPEGLDGRAAQEAMRRYEDSFKAPPPVVNVINIGGASGGAGR